MLYTGKHPAFAAALAARTSRILGVHLNDGYGKRDDGMMVGAVNATATLEFMLVLDRLGYDDVIYFDTFPDTTGLDPVAECGHNIWTVQGMQKTVAGLRGNNALAAAIAAQDAVTSQRIIRGVLFPYND